MKPAHRTAAHKSSSIVALNFAAEASDASVHQSAKRISFEQCPSSQSLPFPVEGVDKCASDRRALVMTHDQLVLVPADALLRISLPDAAFESRGRMIGEIARLRVSDRNLQ